MKNYVEGIDAWIKQVRGEFTNLRELIPIVDENVDNIQHNYELINEMKDEINDLKQEIKALKLMHIISLKQRAEIQQKI